MPCGLPAAGSESAPCHNKRRLRPAPLLERRSGGAEKVDSNSYADLLRLRNFLEMTLDALTPNFIRGLVTFSREILQRTITEARGVQAQHVGMCMASASEE